MCGYFDSDGNPVKGSDGNWNLLEAEPLKLEIKNGLELYNALFEVNKDIRVVPNGELDILYLTSDRVKIKMSK